MCSVATSTLTSGKSYWYDIKPGKIERGGDSAFITKLNSNLLIADVHSRLMGGVLTWSYNPNTNPLDYSNPITV